MPSFKPTLDRHPNLRELPVVSFLDRFTTTQTALDLLFKTDSSFTATVNQMVEDGDPVPDLLDEMALTQRWFLDLAEAVGASRDRLVEGVQDALRGAAAAGARLASKPPLPLRSPALWRAPTHQLGSKDTEQMGNHITPSPLVYNGEVITQRDQMISLTDMWKAQGADPARQPANWLASTDAKNFIEVLNPGNSGVMAKSGKNGGTYANWQIALAYAKYLSPEFHIWCNTVVRERMEGKSASTAVLSSDVMEMIRRDDGIAKMLAHKVTEQGRAISTLVENMATLMAIVQPSAVSLPDQWLRQRALGSN